LADFGAVSVFNFDTFTTAIYRAWSGLFSIEVASQLASLLLVFVALATTLEQYARRDARHVQDGGRRAPRYALSGVRALGAALACAFVFGIAFVVPVLQLLLWTARSATSLDPGFLRIFGHSLGLGVAAAFA